MSDFTRTTLHLATALLVAGLTWGCATGLATAEDSTTCEGSDDPERLEGCHIVDGDVLVEGRDPEALDHLADLRVVTGSLKIRQNPDVTTLAPLRNLERVGGELQLVTMPDLETLEGLAGLNTVGGRLHAVELGVAPCRVDALVDRLDSGPDGVETVNLADSSEACASETDTGDLPVDELPELAEMRRGDLLEGVHPEFRDRIRLMYALLEREGIEIRFVSGYRPHESFYDAENRHASWHNLGMAVDLNLAHRDSLEEAEKHFEGEDADDWQRIGEIANGLGIIWGEWFDDIFHFEWHPDYHARIRDGEYAEFRRMAGDDLEDYREVWSLFEDGTAEDDADDCSGGCHVIPDEGLRRLLEALRSS